MKICELNPVTQMTLVTEFPQNYLREHSIEKFRGNESLVTLESPHPTQDWRKRSRPTIVQRHEILTFVTDLLRQGFSRPIILSFCEEKYGIKRAQIDRIIREAKQQFWGVSQPVYLKAEVAKAVEMLLSIFKAARDAGQYSTAIKAQIEINRILGLNNKNIFGKEE